MDDRIVRAEMRRQIEARALAVAEIVSCFLERVPRHVEWDAIERALRIRDFDAIEIVDRHGPVSYGTNRAQRPSSDRSCSPNERSCRTIRSASSSSYGAVRPMFLRSVLTRLIRFVRSAAPD
ncbi:hypothetical protein [Burkholderia dolosa]|uniref:hypothetical protein n=1 Tax=Burkholderia dolosa TaxID=152500 RepID=UPI001590897A|nr:hypothetical protein [Burkholderia dolosa]MBY4753483.1 hypothetical protein [Burkholderia dolosa]